MDYTQNNSRKKTSQSQAILGREKEQVKNNAGGYSFAIDKWSILNRFLILGTEGGTGIMNMIVCVKQVIDPEAPPASFKVDPSSNKELLFEAVTPLGFRVRTTRDYWNLITTKRNI